MKPTTKKYIQNCTGPDCAKNQKSHGVFSRILFYLLLIVFLGVSVYVLFFSPFLEVTHISVSGTKELDPEEISQALENYNAGNFLGILPKNNFLLISTARMEKGLENDFKKIRSATAVKKFPDSLLVTVEERSALLIWCGADNCFLVDENGVAYAVADFSSPEVVQNHLIKITDTSGRSVSLGEKILEPSYVEYASGIRDSLGSLGLALGDEYFTPSRMSEEISAKTTQGADIYFSTQFPLSSAVRTLGVVFKKELPPEKQAGLAYVDLRTENKVFYKMKDSPLADNQTQGDKSEDNK